MSTTPADTATLSGFNPAEAWLPAPFAINKVKREIPGIYTFELAPMEGDGFRFGPGQFNMLYVFGNGEVPISISGDPGPVGQPHPHGARGGQGHRDPLRLEKRRHPGSARALRQLLAGGGSGGHGHSVPHQRPGPWLLCGRRSITCSTTGPTTAG